MTVSLFPYENVRKSQDQLLNQIDYVVKNNENLLVHAPTGLGKTSASLAATLSNTLGNKTVFFLTSMNTQHKLALDTLNDIKRKHDVKIVGVDVIGKKHLCLQPGVKNLSAGEFIEYCKTLRNEGKCKYYNNLKKNEEYSFNTKMAVNEFKEKSPVSTDEALNIGEKNEVCPYEASLIVGKESNVIVTDYYYLFNPKIRESFLKKIGKELEDIVIIIDEAHNLPGRVKDLASEDISNITLNLALKESEEFGDEELSNAITSIREKIQEYADNIEKESYISKEEFMDSINEFYPYDELVENLDEKAEKVREEKKKSFMGSLSSFLASWKEDEEGFVRIFSKKPGMREEIQSLSHRCLDPGVITKPVIEQAASTIAMSGTLNPTKMYKEILGFPHAAEMTLKSPFPEENRLNLVIPKTTTKYSQRSEDQYKNIANTISGIVNNVPGNSAVFLPSYKLRDSVYRYMQNCNKTVFLERQGLNKQEREEILEKFKSYKESGAVLLGVSSGSFAEGVDLPGDLLKSVIVVGLPLQVPDLETKALIKYYDEKFGKGWDYGYLFPAFNKTLQSAGRCIRSGTDRGVIVFLDERYGWPNYMKCFPPSWNLKTTVLYEGLIKGFFNK